MAPVKDADYYIDRILFGAQTLQEMKDVKAEVDVWIQSASKDEVDNFVDSGAGEMLRLSTWFWSKSGNIYQSLVSA